MTASIEIQTPGAMMANMTVVRLVFLSLVVCIPLLAREALAQQELSGPKRRSPELGREDIATIREAVFTKPVAVCLQEDSGQIPKRAVVVPEEIRQVHTRSRIGTMKVLLDIVKGGRAEDCVKAGAYAIALEKSATMAVMCARHPLHLVDEIQWNDVPTFRENISAWVEELLLEARRVELQRQGMPPDRDDSQRGMNQVNGRKASQ